MLDFWTVGLATFVLGTLALAVMLLVTGGRRWHDRYHTNRTEIMCDRCMARWKSSRDAPPLRALGTPRR